MGKIKLGPQAFGLLISGGILITSFNNCTKISTTNIDPLQKSKTLGTPVISDPGGDDVPRDGNRDGGGEDVGNSCTPRSIPVSYDCSNARTLMGSNAMLSTAVSVKLQVGNCTDSDPAILSALINQKKIVSVKCKAELDQQSCLNEKDNMRISLIATNAAGKSNEIISSHTNDDILYVLFDINERHDENFAKCDNASSPLFVLLKEAEQVKPVEFTAPLDGIVFDIYGQRSSKPFLISWYKNENLYFLAKPNAQGEVKSADELFGDNTKGPDGRYASNGYLALAKFDSDSDGKITKNDLVYDELRLWNDANYDGVSQLAELHSLDEKNIEVIDLDYDQNYREEDRWGNKILYKSVMRTEDQELHVMFDIWFRTLPASLKEPRLIGAPVARVPLTR